MGLDDRDDEQTKEIKGAAKDVDGIPYCRKHHCRMRQTSGGRKASAASYYGCPVPKCGEKAQKIKSRIEGVVPQKPLECPNCKGRGKVSYCERGEYRGARQDAVGIVLVCPLCNWASSPLPRPELAAQHLENRTRRQEYTPDVGDR